jgi:outer membrane protein TolC
MRPMLILALLLVLSGCASVNFEQSIAKTNEEAFQFTQGQLALSKTTKQRTEMEQLANALLSQPINQNDAVRLALINSPALQAMLAQNWANAAQVAQTGRINNPIFTFERIRFADELELGRLLSFGLLDLLTLPQRYQMATQKKIQQQLKLTTHAVDMVTQVRQSWVRAVAAKQNLIYAKQVNDAAQASSELARRLHAVGNFSKLQRAMQQAFYADAAAQWATAQHASTSTQEELTR